jgi:hypothetical protein
MGNVLERTRSFARSVKFSRCDNGLLSPALSSGGGEGEATGWRMEIAHAVRSEVPVKFERIL